MVRRGAGVWRRLALSRGVLGGLVTALVLATSRGAPPAHPQTTGGVGAGASPMAGAVTDTRYGFALPVPRGWTVRAADGLPLADSAQLMLVPPVGAPGLWPISVRVRLDFGVPAPPDPAVHVTTSPVHIAGCSGTLSTAVSSAASPASDPTTVHAECAYGAYVFSWRTSGPPAQAAPPPVFTEVLDAWRWRTPALPANPGLRLSSVHMVSATVGWGLRTEVAGSGGPPATLWRTTDGGVSWNVVSPPALATQRLVGWTYLGGSHAWLAVIPPTQSPDTLVTVLRTSDGGAIWQSSTVRVPLADQTNFPLSLSFADGSHGWLLAHPEYTMNEKPGDLYATDDGGATWQAVSHVTFNRNYGGPRVTQGLPAGGSVTLGGAGAGWLVAGYTSTTPAFLFRGTGGGTTWSPVSLPVPAGATVSVRRAPTLFSGASFGYLTAQAYGPGVAVAFGMLVYVTHDGGSTWTPLKLPGASAESVVSFLGDGHGWLWIPKRDPTGSARLRGGTLYTTTDGGAEWNPLPAAPAIAGLLAVGGNIIRLDFTTSTDGWALLQLPGEHCGRLLRTTDGGLRWSPAGEGASASAPSGPGGG